MEETREFTSARIDATATPEGREASSQELTLPQFLSDASIDFEDMAGALLEWAIARFQFERGILLRQDGASEEFEVVSTRARAGEGPDSTWREVRNPEFAVNRSIITRALAAAEVVAVDDCLIPPDLEASGRPASVLSKSFRLSADSRGVFYLDRGPGMEGIPREQAQLFGRMVESCCTSLSRAFLESEVVRLRARVEGASLEEEAIEPSSTLPEIPSFHGIIGTDEKLREIFRIVEKIKDSGLNVCVFGESGTGKELVAKSIHAASERRDQPFISENCGSIAETLLESELFGHMKGSFTGADEDKIGLFEAADQGTLFLDEIGDMSEGMQSKLLRALQENSIRPIGAKAAVKVDVRVIGASNRDLKLLVKEGKFRADLYYRLNVVQIQVPALRDRRGDIQALIDHFAAEFMREEKIHKRFSESALTALSQYSWPGNVRELRNVIRRVLLTCPRRVIARKDVMPLMSNEHATTCLGENLERDDQHLLLRIPLRQHFNDIIDECERLVLLNALKENGWNKSRVTKVLGIPRQSLYNKIAKHDLKKTWSEPETS